MIVVFDTETSGKPINYRAKMSDLDNWPRVIQLAFALYDNQGNCIDKQCHLIKPDGWVVPNETFWIENGFTNAENLDQGIPIEQALYYFVESAKQADTLVAHNLTFDYNVLGAELLRAKMSVGKKFTQYCTMVNGTDICQLSGGYNGQFKWPKLIELHQHLFNQGFDGAHDALNDVDACARCYFEMNKELQNSVH